MKKILFAIVALVFVVTQLQAQLKPEAGSFGLGFHITGIANTAFFNWSNTGISGQTIVDPVGILPAGTTVNDLVPQEMMFGRYYLSSNLALRVGLGINSFSNKTNSVDTLGGFTTTTDTKLSGFSFGLSAGVEKHFASAASKLDPYAGAQVSFSSLGAITGSAKTVAESSPAFSAESVTKLKGGSSFGLDLLAGFNYFFSDNFALGAEFSWGYHMVSMGGEYTDQTTTVSGGTTVIVESSATDKMSWSGFKVGSTAGVNASIFW